MLPPEYQRLLELAREKHHLDVAAYAQFHTGLLRLWRREAQLAEEHAQAVLDVADQHEFQIWKAVATCLRGAALVGLSRAEEGLAQTKRGMELYRGLKTPPVFWPLLLFTQAGACGQAGRPAEGLIPLEQAMKVIGDGSESPLSSLLCRLKAELLLALRSENPSEGEPWFKRALEIARKRQAGMLELQAALGLSRLWRAQGRSAEARGVLSDAYGRLTEGFATADLEQARSLLADLA